MAGLRISLTLICATPPSVGAGGTAGTLADKVVTRNARGQFIIPGSQVKGKLRHACEQLLRSQGVPICRSPHPETMCPHAPGVAPPCPLCAVFGSPAHPSLLRFHDLVAVQKDLPDETLRTMVSLNRRRRTAEEQRLFLVETAPYLSGLQFENAEAITGHVRDRVSAHLLLAGAKMLFAWGGGTSRGLGWGELKAQAWLDGVGVSYDPQEVRRLCKC